MCLRTLSSVLLKLELVAVTSWAGSPRGWHRIFWTCSLFFLLSAERPLFYHTCLHSLLCLDLVCARSKETHVATWYQENMGPVSSVASSDVERGSWHSFVRRSHFQHFISLRRDFWPGDSLPAPYDSSWVCLESRCLFSCRLTVWGWNYQVEVSLLGSSYCGSVAQHTIISFLHCRISIFIVAIK